MTSRQTILLMDMVLRHPKCARHWITFFDQSINLIVGRTVMKLSLGYTHNYFQIAPKEEILFIFQVWWLVMIIRNSRLRGFSMKKVKEFEVLFMCSLLPFLVCWLKMKGQTSIPNESQGHCITIICLITTILLPLLQSSVSQLIFFFSRNLSLFLQPVCGCNFMSDQGIENQKYWW